MKKDGRQKGGEIEQIKNAEKDKQRCREDGMKKMRDREDGRQK